MHMKSVRKPLHVIARACFIPAIFGILIQSLVAGSSHLPEKHPLDQTEYERFVMENGLKVLIVSDPKLDKASAAMAIGVGSLMDPPERQGLAHFLEHMLFLGTEKYPDAAEYSNYLQTNGGYSNAYTAGDHTNYHFEVYPFAFEGALDRFAQFFIAPLFSEEFTEREKNAVNSEHQKNLENDFRRAYQLQAIHYNPDHPANHFSTGNLDTLGDIAPDEFISFYNTYYSADQMALALVGPNSLAEMKQWVKQYFAVVKNKNVERVTYPTDYILPSDQFRLIEIEPIKDVRYLGLEFPLPSTLPKWDSRSEDMISYIIGFEGKGSLLSALKQQGWATSLSSYVSSPTPDYSALNIRIELTPEGLPNHREIIQMVFSYLNLMKQSDFPAYLFEERKTMSRLNELYSDKGEGAGRATELANQALFYPLDLAERVPYYWNEADPDFYFALLNEVKPQRMMGLLMAKGVETDQIEPIYGTPYRYSESDPEFLDSLANQEPLPGLTLPEPNPFIPAKVDLLAERPVKLIDEKGLRLFYSQDQEFLRPKVGIQFKIRHDDDFVTLENTVLKDLYAKCVEESLNELSYPALTAGLSYSVIPSTEGLYLTMGGYSESALKLMNLVIEEMKALTIEPARFEAIKERTIRGLESFSKNDAWQLAREEKRKLFLERYFSPEDRVELVKQATLESVRDFAKKLFKKNFIEALVHGNLSQQQAEDVARQVAENLQKNKLKASEVFDNGRLVLEDGDTALRVLELEVNNSAYWAEYVVGDDDTTTRAVNLILANFVSEPYYSELRTQQQLGYIVSAFAGRELDQQILYFVVQSGNYPASVIRERSEAFIATLPEALATLPDEGFERLRTAAIAKVEETYKSIGEKASAFFELAFELDEDFDRNQATLEALNAMTKDQVVDVLTQALSVEKASRRVILAFGREHAKELQEGDLAIVDLAGWKAEQTYE
jgi:insulysin